MNSQKPVGSRPNSPIEFAIDELGNMRNVRDRLVKHIDRLLGPNHLGGGESSDAAKALPPTGRLVALESAAQDSSNLYSEIDDLFNRIEGALA